MCDGCSVELSLIGVMGLSRGASLARDFAQQPGVEVTYVCDVAWDRIQQVASDSGWGFLGHVGDRGPRRILATRATARLVAMESLPPVTSSPPRWDRRLSENSECATAMPWQSALAVDEAHAALQAERSQGSPWVSPAAHEAHAYLHSIVAAQLCGPICVIDRPSNHPRRSALHKFSRVFPKMPPRTS
jgi:hypothetical protein